jgi:hypothetical protein
MVFFHRDRELPCIPVSKLPENDGIITRIIHGYLTAAENMHSQIQIRMNFMGLIGREKIPGKDTMRPYNRIFVEFLE